MIGIHTNRKQREEGYRADWNEYRENEFEADKLNRLYEIYQLVKEEEEGIDDITWSDMEMDVFFSKVNYTSTTMGETMLYRLLRSPLKTHEEFHERKRQTSFLYANEKARIEKKIALDGVGKINDTSIYEFKDICDNMQTFSLLPHYVYPILVLVGLLIMLFRMETGLPVFLIAIILSLQSYYKDKAKIEYQVPALFQFGRMLQSIAQLDEKTGYEELDKCMQDVEAGKKIAVQYQRYMQNIRVTVGGKISMVDDVAEYARLIMHQDLKSYKKLIELIKENYEIIVKCYEAVGYLDALMAIAECKRMYELKWTEEKDICTPEFLVGGEKRIYIENMFHPLIEDAVPNSVDTCRSMLITGSNATGKSTFLRTLGINAIAAQTLCFTMCKTYKAPFFRIMSSMSLKDNLFLQESYYVTEIKSIKRILNAINEPVPVLCFLDEVLRGTNTIERISAASEILRSIEESNALCIAASHDIELTYILEGNYDNYHFQEQVSENGLSSDFILYKDRSYTRNAIRLLKYMGYSEEIVENAIKRVEAFLETGKWKI